MSEWSTVIPLMKPAENQAILLVTHMMILKHSIQPILNNDMMIEIIHKLNNNGEVIG